MDVLSAVLALAVGMVGSQTHDGHAYIRQEDGIEVRGPWYSTAELNRFCMTSQQAWNHYCLCYEKLSNYEEDCRKADIEPDNNYRYYMIKCANTFLYLHYAKNIWLPVEQRLRHIDNLKEELGFFSIGQVLHWFDAGYLPGY